ncbi:MAG: LamG domain-containing protein, partial [Patescibacteria group bacterium]|nr:LamG domain-containing protein [Patescibacteria group bacterium]
MNNNWLDSKGTNHGTRYGTGVPFETTSPKLGVASGKFNGVNDRVVLPTPVTPLGSKTLEVWIKTSSTKSNQYILASGICSSGSHGVGLGIYNGKAFFQSMKGSGSRFTLFSSVFVNNGNWHHIVGTWDGTTAANGVKLYVDGVLETQGTANAVETVNPTYNLCFGQSPECTGYNYWFDGLIDEVAIYNRALSAEEIKQHYEAGSPAETSFYRSPRFDLGVPTKVASANVTKTVNPNTDLKVYIRSGNTSIIDTDAIPVSGYRDTSKADFEVGTKTNCGTTEQGELRANQEISSSESGLVGLWHMNNNWLDSSGNGNHGTAYNGATFTTSAKLGSHAGSFDGVDDYVRIPDDPSLDFGTGNFSVEAWINVTGTLLTSQKEYGIVNKNSSFKGNNGWGMEVSTWGALEKKVHVAFYITSQSAWGNTNAGVRNQLSDVWHHVVGVRQGETIKLYFDGVLASEKVHAEAALSVDNNQPIVIGNHEWGPNFPGLIDEVAIYNRALSASEIQQHYEAGSPAHSSTYESSVMDLGSAYSGDLLAIQADVPTGTSLSAQVRAG